METFASLLLIGGAAFASYAIVKFALSVHHNSRNICCSFIVVRPAMKCLTK
jgi:hypothetical protein